MVEVMHLGVERLADVAAFRLVQEAAGGRFRQGQRLLAVALLLHQGGAGQKCPVFLALLLADLTAVVFVASPSLKIEFAN
jgi:hypothetical protein